jgi:hypothetical protein
MRPLPVDSILAQLKHLLSRVDNPSWETLERITLRRQLVMEWSDAPDVKVQEWIQQCLSVVQEYYDWVKRHDEIQMEIEPGRESQVAQADEEAIGDDR